MNEYMSLYQSSLVNRVKDVFVDMAFFWNIIVLCSELTVAVAGCLVHGITGLSLIKFPSLGKMNQEP